MSKCKRAFIRKDKDDDHQCPFGLPIPNGCENAGECVAHMAPLEMVDEEKRDRVAKANKRVYVHYRDGKRCPYAVNIMKDQKTTNCNFGDHAQGASLPKALEGSPLYAQTFSGVGSSGLYAFPLGFYADNNESRNLFHGLFSLLGEITPNIVKQGVREKDQGLWKKIEKGESLSHEEQEKLNSILENIRNEVEDSRDDPGKVKELVDKWNPRKRL